MGMNKGFSSSLLGQITSLYTFDLNFHPPWRCTLPYISEEFLVFKYTTGTHYWN